MNTPQRILGVLVLGAFALVGCGNQAGSLFSSLFGKPTGLAGEIASKASTIANLIGGTDGYGGMAMNDYRSGMEDHMGFHSTSNLAGTGDHMTMMLHNNSSQTCTFHIQYLSSPLGSGEQAMDVTVPAGTTQTINMPCSEIVGLGDLTNVGDSAVSMMDGTMIDNRMCVPGFMGTDYHCGDTFNCYVGHDTNDLNGNGDTHEMMAFTQAMQMHMNEGGHGMGSMMGG